MEIRFNEAMVAVDLNDKRDAKTARAIVDAADEGGTIQAEDMVRIFQGRPRLHTATSMHDALALLGSVREI